ncbi:uncharacterized protein LOC114318205 [Camellia sinensis]|uniref:uncharacterized protein LOC114318205 n=1 Tax=Camellia sinensis TaxID=4442 RepID=UPI001036E25C|nr:uncharacterized protein LOC114318205 [Camellia sinensis]
MVDTRANGYTETSNNVRNCPRHQHGPISVGADIPNNLRHQILEELGKIRNNRQNERTRLFSEFQKQRPPKFKGIPDPKIAKNWLRQIEKMLDTMGITDAADRIALAIFEPDDEADHCIIRRERVKEIQNLEQGNMTVTQYASKFEELARYATRYVANDEEKARMFEWGLDLTIWGRVLPQRLPSYAEVLETALESEREVNDARKAWN